MEDGPGEPKDPVRLLRIRPCHLLGQLLAASLYPIAVHLRDTYKPTAD